MSFRTALVSLRRMDLPPIVTPAEWRAARQELLAKEKAQMQASDALAAERRRQPMTSVDKDYVFEGPAGPTSLPDLFDGRRQLITYHHMLKPADPAPCPGCCMLMDQIGDLAHLHARDTSFVVVARAPVDEIEAFRQKMGWAMPWYSSLDTDFDADHDVNGGFGLNVFLRDGDRILRTYFTTDRGVETLGTVWSLLDITPLGRQEQWEDSPAGYPQTEPFMWWRRHDEYSAA